MKQFLKEYFNFSRTERMGIQVLLAIVILLTIHMFVQVYYPPEQKKSDFSRFECEILAFESQFVKQEVSGSLPDRIKGSLFAFDPNHLSLNKWLELGLEERVVKTIRSYLDKGGKFRIKKDLSKIYGLRKEDYQRLYPYIQLPVAKPSGKSDSHHQVHISTAERNSPVDVNRAGLDQLIQVRGLGPVFAGRIVKYRELLGGFYHLDQLKEVYGINEEVFEGIRLQLQLNDTVVRKLNINDCTAGMLMTHPYISDWKVANAVVSYREAHGPYKRAEDLNKIHLIKPEWLDRIRPYLTIQ